MLTNPTSSVGVSGVFEQFEVFTSLLNSPHVLFFPGVCTTVCNWVASDDFHICECSFLWYRGAPTGFLPTLTGALRSHRVCERSFHWSRLQRPVVVVEALTTLKASNMQPSSWYFVQLVIIKVFEEKMINVLGLKATCLVGFYSSCVRCNFPKMFVPFLPLQHPHHFILCTSLCPTAALITLSWAFLLQTWSTHLYLKYTFSQTHLHNCVISERESLSTVKDIWQLSSPFAGQCH